MSTNAESSSVKVQNAFRALTAAADHLNSVSDQLGKPIAELETLLKKLNLGVVVWARMEGEDHEFGEEWWSRDIGYAKIGGKWGIALRTCSGDYQRPKEDVEEAWQFNEAPRWIRVLGVDHIPTLIEKMVTETNQTAQKIKGKVSEASDIVTAVRGAFPDSKQK
jgi:hypothetical protein